MANNLIFEYRKAFEMLDPENLGRISMLDLSSLLTSIGVNLNESEIYEIVARVLGFNDNLQKSVKCIDFSQFLSALSATITDCISDDEIKRIFREFDKDGDGFISPHELRALLLRLGDDVTEKEIQEMMQEADLDGDGFVNLSEFIQVISTSPAGITIDHHNTNYDVTVNDICNQFSKLTSKYSRTQSHASIQSQNSIASSSNSDTRHPSFEKKVRRSKRKSFFGSKRRKSVVHWFKQF